MTLKERKLKLKELKLKAQEKKEREFLDSNGWKLIKDSDLTYLPPPYTIFGKENVGKVPVGGENGLVEFKDYNSGGSSESPIEFLEITESQKVNDLDIPLLTLNNMTYIKECFKNKKHIIIIWYENLGGGKIDTHYLNIISCNDFGNYFIIVKPSSTFDYEIKYSIHPTTSEVLVEVKSYAWQSDLKKIKGLKDIDYLSFLNDDGDLQYLTLLNDFEVFGLNISSVVVNNNSINSSIQLIGFGDAFGSHSANEEIAIAKIDTTFTTINNKKYSTLNVDGGKIPITVSIGLENGKIYDCLGYIASSTNTISIFWNSELNGTTPKYINIPIQLFLQEQASTNLLQAANKVVDENIKLEKHWAKIKAKKGK